MYTHNGWILLHRHYDDFYGIQIWDVLVDPDGLVSIMYGSIRWIIKGYNPR